MNENKIISPDIEAALITGAQNMRYFSGFTGGEGALLITAEKKYIFVDGRYTIQAKNQTKGYTVADYRDMPSVLCKYGFCSLGFEDRQMTYSSYERLTADAKGARLIGISDKITSLRSVKNKDEIAKIRTAAAIADSAFAYILPLLKEGVTECDIALELEYFMRKNGAEGVAFDTIVAFGERTALPHAFPTARRLVCGDTVLMDYGCMVDGYCSDMTRTVFFGKASDRQREIYSLVLKAQNAALEIISAGIAGTRADGAARDVFKAAGYEKNFCHSLGHGVGLYIHEQPTLSPRSEDVLTADMLVTVEPGLYFENELGVRIEDLVAVTGGGYDNLTVSSKAMCVL